MYYESRVHEVINMEDAYDAAEKIKNGTIRSYQVAAWPGKDKQYQFFAVPDGHIDNPMLELAILRKEIANSDSPYQQVESITNGWIESPEVLGKYLIEAEVSEWIMASNTQLIVGSPKGNETANFTCGCCGSWFEGNVKNQLKFDQDAGYGICNNCKMYY